MNEEFSISFGVVIEGGCTALDWIIKESELQYIR